MKNFVWVFIAVFLSHFSYAQHLHNFYQGNSLRVLDENQKDLKNPFGGGLKFPVFTEIDLDRNSKPDLVVLDKVDNRVLTFLNVGEGDTVAYKYCPEYEAIFPDSLTTFIILEDYNGDQLKDIFTYSTYTGGGAVYRNVGNEDRDSFILREALLESYYKGNFEWKTNLEIFSVDQPAIIDYDADGDLDIMTFGYGGAYMYFFKNCCRELYGNSDSFIYNAIDEYWGYFMETDDDFYTVLGITPPSWIYKDFDQNCADIYKITEKRAHPDFEKRGNGTRHLGSSTLVLDLDGDNDFDLLVGDVEYSKISFLENGRSDFGTSTDTIIAHHFNFPSYDVPVNIRQMPALYPVDVNRDGKKDLIASPIDMVISDTFDNLNQVWLYLNKGTSKVPLYEFQQNDFLQEDMIDLGGASYPAFVDYDADGDQDLFVATRGNYVETFYKADRIVIFENIGSNDSIVYKKIEDDFMNLSLKAYVRMTPNFGDCDGDGDQDMVLGNQDGDLIFYENTAGPGNPVKFVYDTTFSAFIKSGYSAPFVVDMNHDSFGDLIVGEYYGKLSYYQNTGGGDSTSFSLVSDTFGGIFFSGSNHFSSPAVADLDSNGFLDLVMGNTVWVGNGGYFEGRLYIYMDIDKDVHAQLTPANSFLHYMSSMKEVKSSLGLNLRPAVANLDHDNYPDILLGSERGGLILLQTLRDSTQIIEHVTEHDRMDKRYRVFPNPARTYVRIETDWPVSNLKVTVYNMMGKIVQHEVLFGNGSFELVLEDFPSGLYFLNIEEPGNAYIEKHSFIKY